MTLAGSAVIRVTTRILRCATFACAAMTTLRASTVAVNAGDAPVVSLSDVGQLRVEFNGAEVAPTARALAIASADLDEDGVPDLVAGFGDSASGGSVILQLGNVNAICPNSAEAKARRECGESTDAAFHPAARRVAVPEPADHVCAGDFDPDGHWDVVTAQNGGTKLYLVRGDGHGGFSAVQTIELGGTVTALRTGEINRPDALTHVAVAIIAGRAARRE